MEEGAIPLFYSKHIKKGEIQFSIEISKMIGSAFTIRNWSDYDNMFIASKVDTEEQLANADYIYEITSKYVTNMIAK